MIILSHFCPKVGWIPYFVQLCLPHITLFSMLLPFNFFTFNWYLNNCCHHSTPVVSSSRLNLTIPLLLPPNVNNKSKLMLWAQCEINADVNISNFLLVIYATSVQWLISQSHTESGEAAAPSLWLTTNKNIVHWARGKKKIMTKFLLWWHHLISSINY